MRDKVITFLNLTGINKYPDVIAAGIAEQIKGQFDGIEGADQTESITKAVKLMETTLIEKKSVLFDTMVSAYASTFNEGEIDQLVAFYEAPLGRRLVELGGIVLPAVIEAGNTWGVESLKGIESDLEKLLA